MTVTVNLFDWWKVLNQIVLMHGGNAHQKFNRSHRLHAKEEISYLLHELGHLACLPNPDALKFSIGEKPSSQVLEAVIANLGAKAEHESEVFAEVIAARVAAGFKMPITYDITPGSTFPRAKQVKAEKQAAALAALPYQRLPAQLRKALEWAHGAVREEVARLPIHRKPKVKRYAWDDMKSMLDEQEHAMSLDPTFSYYRSSFWKDSKVKIK